MKFEILLNKGLGPLHFGATPEEVKALLGNPTVSDELVRISEFAMRWVYEFPKLSLLFHVGGVFGLDAHASGEKRLYLIGTTSEDVTLLGEAIFGRRIESVLALLKLNCVGHVVEQEEFMSEKCFSFPDSNLNIYVANGIVSNIQWAFGNSAERSAGSVLEL